MLFAYRAKATSRPLLLVVEPSFHVRPVEFQETVGHARNAGLSVVSRPRVLLSRAVLFEKQRENP
ncbi:MAG: hypothetical protein ACP5C4_09475 [Methanomicrobiales archaeon]